MNWEPIFAGLLVLALVVAWLRLALGWSRAGVRPSAWRIAALGLLQPLWIGLLGLTILPPRQVSQRGRLVILTADWDKAGRVAGHRVALPEAGAASGAERSPDLATALRRYRPAGVIVVGRGLVARDRAADIGPLTFEAAPVPNGIVEFAPPGTLTPGATFDVYGRVQGVDGSVELIDPAGRRVDAAALPDNGRFVLHAIARVPGKAVFSLHLRDGGGTILETADVPLDVIAPSAMRLILLGTPDPESKYLRRWATDAGLSVVSRLTTGGGVTLGDTSAPDFSRADVIVVDDRGWAALGAGERGGILAAVRNGAGLLLRATGPAPHDWGSLGFQASGGQLVALDLPKEALDAPALAALRGPGGAIDAGDNAAPTLTRSDLRLVARDAVPFAGDALAGRWRLSGRGRVGIATITDSYALALAGQKARYGALWSIVIGTLGRPHGPSGLYSTGIRYVGDWTTLCNLGSGTTIDGTPLSAAANCAAIWPHGVGWHVIGDRTFYVRPTDQLAALRAVEARDATRALAHSGSAVTQSGMRGVRGASWPWFLGWLGVSALLWTLERLRSTRLPMTSAASG